MSQFCLRRVMATNACRQAQMTWRKTMNGAPKRPKNREVENEMVCPPEKAGQPPRPVTEPAKPAKRRPSRGKDDEEDRKSTRLNSSHYCATRMQTYACKKNNAA